MNDTIDPGRAAALLMEALSSTFADLAFIDVEPAAGAASEKDIVSPLRAAIDVLKPVSCRLEISCPAGLRDRIEAILFQDKIEERGEQDSLLEILNVVAGQFLTLYFGAGTDVKLELPQYLYLAEPDEGAILAQAAGDAEGEPVFATLRSVRYRY